MCFVLHESLDFSPYALHYCYHIELEVGEVVGQCDVREQYLEIKC